jgi:hypothetical protein
MLPPIGKKSRKTRNGVRVADAHLNHVVSGAGRQAAKLRKQAHEDGMANAYLSGARDKSNQQRKKKRKKKKKKKKKQSESGRSRWTPEDDRAAVMAFEKDTRPRWTPQDNRAAAISSQRDSDADEATAAARAALIRQKKKRRKHYENRGLSPIAMRPPSAARNHLLIDPATEHSAPDASFHVISTSLPSTPISPPLTPIATPPRKMRTFNVLERYQHERIPNRIRMPTPVFRTLPRATLMRDFGMYPPEAKFAIPLLQTAFRRFAQRGTLSLLRRVAAENALYYKQACFLQEWARRKMLGWDRSWLAAHYRLMRMAMESRLRPIIALDLVVGVMKHARVVIADIAERAHATSNLACTAIPWWRRLKQMWKDRAMVRRLLLEHRSAKNIQGCWRDSRVRMKVKEAYHMDCAARTIQRIARGHFGRIIADQRCRYLARRKGAIKFQRRWYYYRSRCKAARRRVEFIASKHVQELREAESRLDANIITADDAFYRLLWTGTNCTTRERNAATFRRKCQNRFKHITPKRRRKKYSPRSRVIPRRGAAQDVTWSEVSQSDTQSSEEEYVAGEEENVDNVVDGDTRKCRVQSDRQMEQFFEATIGSARDKATLTMLRMCKAIYLFASGDIESVLAGQALMAVVRKDDKHFACWNENAKRLAFLERWWTTAPGLVGFRVGFDPVHIESLRAIWNWHCFHRFDLAEAAFERAISLAKPDQRPDLRKAFQCTHHGEQTPPKITWKRAARVVMEPPMETIVVKRLFKSYRRFLGVDAPRGRIENVGMVSHKMLLETRVRISKKLMRIKVFVEGTHNFLFDAAAIKRVKAKPKLDKKKKKKKDKKKKKAKPEEVLTGERWTTIVTGEEARSLFINLGRAALLRSPEKVSRAIIEMMILTKLPRNFAQIGSGDDETVLAIRVSTGLEARHKVIHTTTKQGFVLSCNCFCAEDRAMSIQAVRTLTSGKQVDYGVHITLPEIRHLFRDYDYEIKNYRHHPMWRVRAVELIRKMLLHFDLVKKMDTADSGSGVGTYSEKTKARVLTYVDGRKKEELDSVVSFLPEVTDDSSKLTRLTIAHREKREKCAAQGYVAIRAQCWWQGYKGRRRVRFIRMTNAANVIVRYVRPWYLERQGRLLLVQKTIRGHLQRCRTMFLLQPLNGMLRDLRDMDLRLGITLKDYTRARHLFVHARIIMRSRHRRRVPSSLWMKYRTGR